MAVKKRKPKLYKYDAKTGRKVKKKRATPKQKSAAAKRRGKKKPAAAKRKLKMSLKKVMRTGRTRSGRRAK